MYGTRERLDYYGLGADPITNPAPPAVLPPGWQNDPSNPNNYLVPSNGGTADPPVSIPKLYNGVSTANPGYAQDEVMLVYNPGGGTLYTLPDGRTTRTNPNMALMAHVTALVGTAAGVWAGTNGPGTAGINFGGTQYVLNHDDTFTGGGQTYTAAQMQQLIANQGVPIVQQHVDTPTTAGPATDPNAPPNGWNQGSYHGTAGYWGPDGKFYAGPTPWLNPHAVGVSLEPNPAPVPKTSGPPPAAVYTNPDGTPTYNGKPYSATDMANPYNNAGTYIPGGAVGPATPGGGVILPPDSSAPPVIPSLPMGPVGGGYPYMPPPTLTPEAPLQASVLGGISPTVLVVGAIAAFLLFRPRRS